MMHRKITSWKLYIVIGLVFCIISAGVIHAQTETPTPTSAPSDDKVKQLESQISELQSKITEAQKQQKTLSSQISVMDNQIRLTELRIDSTKSQITVLTEDIDTATDKISSLEDSLGKLTKILMNRIVVTYQVGTSQPFQFLIAAEDAMDLFSRLNYLKLAQSHDKKLIFETQQTRNDYANQKEIFESKKRKVESLKAQLETYGSQLEGEKKGKQALLDVTKNDEQRYQKLLKEAQAQVQAFKSFSLSKTGGGVSILPPQSSPDGWYYNQRDERWGRNTIGSSGEQIWDVGCLLTSAAMVLKKHGQDVNPSNVAGNSGYFFSNTAYMFIPWLGGKFTSIWTYDQGNIDSKLSAGEPVIVGVRAGVYGMHFVVLKSGSGGDYVMHDPWNGADLKFTEYYSTGQIFQYGFYNG